MATRSDFAQKLLNDLRLRKERMAATSQSSGGSNPTAARGSAGGGAYGNSGKSYKGSRQIKALESAGSRTVNSQRWSSGSNKSSSSLSIEEASKQIVPGGRGRSSSQTGNPLMAFAYALENGGKLNKNGSILGFLHQFGRKSLEITNTERNITLHKHRSSNSQFKNLSNFQIKEISRGVQNINQILRACSNGINFDTYSIEIGKELLKGAIDLEESLRMIVNLQEASDFMISSPKRQNRITLLDEDEEEEEKTEQKQLDLPRFSFDKPTTRNSNGFRDVSHMLMALTHPGFPRKQPQNTSNEPKKRMSNVIAKLMGLEEELPDKGGSKFEQKEIRAKHKGETGFKRNAAEEIKVAANANPRMVVPDRRDSVPGLKKATIPTAKPNNAQNEQKRTEKSDKKETFSKEEERHKRQENHIGPEVEKIVQEQIGSKKKNVEMLLLSSNQQKQQHNEVQTPRRKSQIGRENMHVRKPKTETNVMSKPFYSKTSPNTKQPRVDQAIRHPENLLQNESSTNSDVDKKNSKNQNSHQNVPPREVGSEMGKRNGGMKEKPVQDPVKRKKVAERKIDAVMTRKNGTLHNKETLKKLQSSMKQRRPDKTSSPKGVEQPSANKIKEPEMGIKRIGKSEESKEILNGKQQLHHEHKQTIASNCPKVPESPASSDGYQDIVSDTCLVFNDHPKAMFSEDSRMSSHNSLADSLNPHGGRTDISYHPQPKQKKATLELLTENEKHLKEILIKGQLFLNTAEALFKLNIPIGILNASDYNFQDEGTKLTLDCGYEIMQRKGRRQELTFHPCLKISVSSIKIRSFDRLVKQLYQDFENLKFYGGNADNEYDSADHLQKMLEKDLQFKDPDLNSMWDFGWNEIMFAFMEKDEVIRDVESYVLDGLLDEMTKDFSRVIVSI